MTQDTTITDELTKETPTEQGEVAINARLALLNWQKYNRDPADEIVYQAEKVASSLEALLASLSHPVSTNMQVAEAVKEAAAKAVEGWRENLLCQFGYDQSERLAQAIRALDLSTITARPRKETGNERRKCKNS